MAEAASLGDAFVDTCIVSADIYAADTGQRMCSSGVPTMVQVCMNGTALA
jgi:hypothetical protein